MAKYAEETIKKALQLRTQGLTWVTIASKLTPDSSGAMLASACRHYQKKTESCTQSV